MQAVLAALFIGLFTSCATKPADDFARLKVGMEKSEVLDIMGDPNVKIRRSGQDRWTWIYYDKNTRQENSVHFEASKAVYIGPRPTPAVSAEERDQKNEESNRDLQKQIAAERERAREALPNYENEVKGNGADGYVPKYEPVR